MDESGYFEITFKHKDSKKELSPKLQAQKRTVYVKPLKEIEVEFSNGTKEIVLTNENDFSYKLEVNEEEYDKGIKGIIAKDSKGKSIKVKKLKYENGICYITLENNIVEKKLIKEKDRKFDHFNIKLNKKKTQQEKPKLNEENEENEKENDKIEFHDGIYTSKIPRYNSIKKIEEQKDNQLTLKVEGGKFKNFEFEYNDTQNLLFTIPLKKNESNLFRLVSRDSFDYFENKEIFDKVIDICNNNIAVEEGNGQGKVKKDFKEVEDLIDVTIGATYSTRSLYKAMKNILEQALQGNK